MTSFSMYIRKITTCKSNNYVCSVKFLSYHVDQFDERVCHTRRWDSAARFFKDFGTSMRENKVLIFCVV